MAKSLRYKVFKIGGIPRGLMTALQSELIEVMDEGIRCSLTYKNFHSPARRSGWRRIWFNGSIAITSLRLVSLRGSAIQLDVPFHDDRFRLLNVSLENEDTLLIGFDASLFHSDWSGTLEYRFRTSLAPKLLDALHRLTS